jgi:hypothetical protein
MFFRRVKVHVLTFDEHLQKLKQSGFQVLPAGPGQARIVKHNCAALVKDAAGTHPLIGKAGILIGDEIGELVDGGFQKFFLTPSGRREPAQAEHLGALHKFEEDVKDSLDITSLYNEGLGTVCDLHVYDRVKDRDKGVPKRAWE